MRLGPMRAPEPLVIAQGFQKEELSRAVDTWVRWTLHQSERYAPPNSSHIWHLRRSAYAPTCSWHALCAPHHNAAIDLRFHLEMLTGPVLDSFGAFSRTSRRPEPTPRQSVETTSAARECHAPT